MPLAEQVAKWLVTEGYPLEFQTAQAFETNGFSTSQGHYVHDELTHNAREIDVVADMTLRFENHGFFRAAQVVECKWSKDKPWVHLHK